MAPDDAGTIATPDPKDLGRAHGGGGQPALLVIRYETGERLVQALSLPAHQWLTPGQTTWLRRFFLVTSVWGAHFCARAVVGPSPGWIEGLVVGVGMYGWAVARANLWIRVQASQVAPTQITLTLDRDRAYTASSDSRIGP